MTMIRRRTVLGGGLAVYLLVAGFAGGMAAERIRLDEAVREWHAISMRVEHAAEAAR